MVPVDVLPGEQILWQGQPVRHRLIWPPDAFVIPFSLVWCGFAVFWEISVLQQESSPGFFALWGAFFVVIGSYFVLGRFVVRAIASRRTRYVVTDRRVIVTGGVTGRRTESLYLKDLPPPIVTERDDRSGTLVFGSLQGIGDLFARRGGGSARRSWSDIPSALPVLADIPEVRYVRDLIANAQARTSQGS